MSAPSNENIHCILICCLLFMTCEGLTGRYDELLQHLAAGDTVFQSLRHQNSSDASDVLDGLVDMFSEMGLASSGFMGDHPLSGIKKWCRSDPETEPWNPDREDGLANDNAFEDRLRRWNSRFKALSQRLLSSPSDDEIAHIQTLQLHYQSLQMYINAYDNKGLQPSHLYKAFIEAAEKVAAPLIAIDQPTFSLDGCLVSGLSFVAISTQGGDEKVQALDLLRKLNHREGIFDSNDIVEMHELVAMDMDWGSGSDSDSDTDIEEPDPPLRAPKGIPQMIEVLARKTGKTSKRLEGLYP
uniref:Fungal N-terminal domain-containing protein n=3 Tax=Fusarium oxysporum TaxID=5507 RepID=A0A0D2XJ84_FUSOF